jgi:hypothetical protein
LLVRVGYKPFKSDQGLSQLRIQTNKAFISNRGRRRRGILFSSYFYDNKKGG